MHFKSNDLPPLLAQTAASPAILLANQLPVGLLRVDAGKSFLSMGWHLRMLLESRKKNTGADAMNQTVRKAPSSTLLSCLLNSLQSGYHPS